MAAQCTLALKERYGWGGARARSGPKPKPHARVRHRKREPLSRHHPVHVTLRVARELGNLRKKRSYFRSRDAVGSACDRLRFRLIHYSVQSMHIHLITEAVDRASLSRGLKGLHIRVARALNELIH